MMVNSSTSSLSALFRQQSADQARLMTQIASGKTFVRPSDDFVSFTNVRNAESLAARYQSNNNDLAMARAQGSIAAGVGNEALSGLLELRDMLNRGRSSEEIAAHATALQEIFNDNNRDGRLGQASASLVNGGAIALNAELPNLDELLRDSDGNITAETIGAAIEGVTKFTAEADAFNSRIDRQMTINQNVISAQREVAASIGSIDEIRAMSESVALTVRQQATMAMAAQANVNQTIVERLFN